MTILVLATGARHGYFGHDDWEKFAPGLKIIENATQLHSHILLAFKQAELETDLDRRVALLTFVVSGPSQPLKPRVSTSAVLSIATSWSSLPSAAWNSAMTNSDTISPRQLRLNRAPETAAGQGSTRALLDQCNSGDSMLLSRPRRRPCSRQTPSRAKRRLQNTLSDDGRLRPSARRGRTFRFPPSRGLVRLKRNS